MIIAEYTISCDGCGLTGSTAPTRAAATAAALADDWTYGGRSLAMADEHWCQPCTESRQENDRG